MAAFDLKDAEIRDLFFKKLFDNRIIMLKCGVKSMRFRPVLDIKKEELDECLDIIEKVIQNI
jgi:L-lysine 6-transaminase